MTRLDTAVARRRYQAVLRVNEVPDAVPPDLEGVFVIEVEAHVDERGLFWRTLFRRELEANGLEPGPLVETAATTGGPE